MAGLMPNHAFEADWPDNPSHCRRFPCEAEASADVHRCLATNAHGPLWAYRLQCRLPFGHAGDHVVDRTLTYQWENTPDHVCGLQGYNPMLGDRCQACDYWKAKRHG